MLIKILLKDPNKEGIGRRLQKWRFIIETKPKNRPHGCYTIYQNRLYKL